MKRITVLLGLAITNVLGTLNIAFKTWSTNRENFSWSLHKRWGIKQMANGLQLHSTFNNRAGQGVLHWRSVSCSWKFQHVVQQQLECNKAFQRIYWGKLTSDVRLVLTDDEIDHHRLMPLLMLRAYHLFIYWDYIQSVTNRFFWHSFALCTVTSLQEILKDGKIMSQLHLQTEVFQNFLHFISWSISLF